MLLATKRSTSLEYNVLTCPNRFKFIYVSFLVTSGKTDTIQKRFSGGDKSRLLGLMAGLSWRSRLVQTHAPRRPRTRSAVPTALHSWRSLPVVRSLASTSQTSTTGPPRLSRWESEADQVANEGSVARDHLANERTFLAWARTGLGFLGGGTAVFTAYYFAFSDEDGLPQHAATTAGPVRTEERRRPIEKVLPACVLLWVNGAVFLFYALHRYFTVQVREQHPAVILKLGRCNPTPSNRTLKYNYNYAGIALQHIELIKVLGGYTEFAPGVGYTAR
eukprot:g17207.t1